MTYPCPVPEFVWLGIFWSPCIRCDRLAWDHEQADPLADLRNHLYQHYHGLPPGSFAPTMRPAETEA